jgi:uncharacterized membrane protein
MSDAVAAAIRAYFAGERAEMGMLLAGCAVALALSIAHMTLARDAFARGLGIVVVIGVLILASTAIGLLRRDPGIESPLVAALATERRDDALTAERARIGVVISKYPIYRYSALALSLLSLIGIAVTRRPMINGVAAGVLLLTVTLLIVDHHSEQRARGYEAALDSARR